MTHGPVAPIAAAQLATFLVQVGLLLGLALMLGRAAERVGMPALVGELAVGVVLGPSLLGHVAPGLVERLVPPTTAQFHLLDAVGQVGVVLLVALTGMHIDIGLVRRRAGTGLTISATGLVVPLALGVAVGYRLPSSFLGEHGNRLLLALFLGVAMCVSALPVIARTLADMRLLHRDVGQLTLVSGMVDDAVGWLLLSMVSGLATVGLRTGDIVLSVVRLAGVLAVAYVVGRPAVRVLFRYTERAERPNRTVGAAVALVLLCAAGTQVLGLEAVFGAFVAGILIGTSARIEPGRLASLQLITMSVLAPVFFATVGLRIDLTALAKPRVLVAALVILTVAVVGKFLGAFLGARLCRLNRWEAVALGAGMNSRGVVEIVVAMAGLRLGLLTTDTFTIVVLVAVITSVMAPPLLRFAMRRLDLTAEEQARRQTHEAFEYVGARRS